ncbi:MAG: hypothetical protein Q9218_000577 [Villophora microphyllina]
MARIRHLLLLVSVVLADVQLYPNNTLITTNTISSACHDAMNANIACDPYLVSLATNNYYGTLGDTALQNSVCASNCGTALSNYHNAIHQACGQDEEPWIGVPANYFGDLVWAQYNLTCIKDPATSEWCSDYISNLTLAGDSQLTVLPKNQLCSPCIIALAQHLQGTAYSNYDGSIATQWKSIQTTCGLNLPTDPQPPIVNSSISIPDYVQEGTTQTAKCFSGNTYAVVAGDNIQKIAAAKHVSSGALAILNGILPDGSNLFAGSNLCLPQTCQTYLVQAGDTCAGIASANGISYTQFRSYNPSINSQCTNLLSGTNVCLSLPGTTYTGTTIAGATVTKTDIYASATIAPPSNIASGTTRKCGKYYQVQPGDFCQKVAINNTIDITLFEAINHGINQDCTNLIPGESYCVFPTPDWNVTATATQPPPTTTPTGTTNQCYEWHVIVSGDYCYKIAQEYDITVAQLQTWNPSLAGDCVVVLGEAYCVAGPTGTAGGANARMAKRNSIAKPTSTARAKNARLPGFAALPVKA